MTTYETLYNGIKFSEKSKSYEDFMTKFDIHEKLKEELNKLTDNDIYVDVGACIGTTCLLLNKGTCFAFEPNPVAIEELLENIKLNPGKKFIVAKTACSNRETTYKLIPHERLGEAKIILDEGTDNTIIIDRVFVDIRLPVKVIKIDAEGHDYFVLLGAEKTIKRDHPVVFIETNEYKEDIFNFLKKNGYEVETISNNFYAKPQKNNL